MNSFHKNISDDDWPPVTDLPAPPPKPQGLSSIKRDIGQQGPRLPPRPPR